MSRVFRHVITGLVSILLDAIILRSRLQAGRGRRRRRREGRGREKGAGGRREVSSAPGCRGWAHRASCCCSCCCCRPGTPGPASPEQGTGGSNIICGARPQGGAFTGISRGGGGGLEVLKNEVKDTPRPPPFFGKVLGGVAWAARGLGGGGAAWSEL